MEIKYLIGKDSCPLKRRLTVKPKKPVASFNIQSVFLREAVRECYEFFDCFFDSHDAEPLIKNKKEIYNNLADEIMISIKRGEELNLFQYGGIPKRDFVSLWCLFKYLKPSQYTESGVFIGSSFFACIEASPETKILGIDPNLKPFRIPKSKLGNATLTDKFDFEESSSFIGNNGTSLAYFDCHINSAKRIIQAASKGYDFIIFDDSLGLEGTTGKKYPAFPTIPFILHSKELEENDYIEWSYDSSRHINTFKEIVKSIFFKFSFSAYQEISGVFSNSLIGLCKEANSKIEKCSKLPQLGDYILPNNYNQGNDSSKFIIKLKKG